MIGDMGSSTIAKYLGSVTDAESEDDVVLAWEFQVPCRQRRCRHFVLRAATHSRLLTSVSLARHGPEVHSIIISIHN